MQLALLHPVLYFLIALQSNAKRLLLEVKLAAKPTDEVSRWVELYFMKSNCGIERIFQQYASRRSLFYKIISVIPSRHLIHRKRSPSPQGQCH